MGVFTEDIGRPGFSGLLAETDSRTPDRGAGEGPGGVVPVALSWGVDDPANGSALEQFQVWLDQARRAASAPDHHS